MDFEVTKHCLKRMIERDIPTDLKGLLLRRVGKGEAKKIKRNCPNSPHDTKVYVYWKCFLNRKELIIVSIATDIGRYKAITAFYKKTMNEPPPKPQPCAGIEHCDWALSCLFDICKTCGAID